MPTQYDYCQKALTKLHWKDFFQGLTVCNEQEQSSLLDEALCVAKLMNLLPQAQQIIKHPKFRSLSSGISVLFEFDLDLDFDLDFANGEATVLHIATLSDDPQKQQTAWRALADHFFDQSRWEDLQKILPNIQANSQRKYLYVCSSYYHSSPKKHLLNRCVDKLNPLDDLMLFLWFFEQKCLEDPPGQSFYEPRYYSSHQSYRSAQETQFDNLLAVLEAHQPFTDVSQRLKDWPEPISQQGMIKRLYLRVLVAQNETLYPMLDAILPVSLRWMSELKLMFVSDDYFHLLEGVKSSERDQLRSIAFEAFFHRSVALDDESFSNAIIQTSKYKPLTSDDHEPRYGIKTGEVDFSLARLLYEECIKQKRINVVIHFLLNENSGESYQKTGLAEMLLECELFVDQFDRLMIFIVSVLNQENTGFYSVKKFLEKALIFKFDTRHLDSIVNFFVKVFEGHSKPDKELLMLLLRHPLTEQHYRALLSHIRVTTTVRKYGSSECRDEPDAEIISRIPLHLVAEEIVHRQQKEHAEALAKAAAETPEGKAQAMQAKLAECKKIHNIHQKKYKEYRQLTDAIDYFTEQGDIRTAFALCKRIVKAKYRDGILRRLVIRAIELAQYDCVQPVYNLFCKKDNNSVIRKLVALFRKNKYRQAYQYMHALSYAQQSDFSKEMDFCVKKILEDPSVGATIFLVNAGHIEDEEAAMLSRDSNTGLVTAESLRYHSHFSEIITDRIMQEFIHITAREIKAYLDQFIFQYFVIFIPYLVEALLKSNHFDLAVVVANYYDQHPEIDKIRKSRDFYSPSSPDKNIIEHFTDYFYEFRYSHRRKITALDLKRLQPLSSNLQEGVLSAFSMYFSPDEASLTLLEAVGETDFQQRELFRFVEECLCDEKYSLAKRAALLLSGELQLKYQKFIDHYERQQFSNIWCLLRDDRLAPHFNIQSAFFQQIVVEMLRGHSSKTIFQFSKQMHDQLVKLHIEQESSQGSRDWHMQSFYSDTFRVAYGQWIREVLDAEHYLAALEGTEKLLTDRPAKFYTYPDPFEQLPKIAMGLAKQGDYQSLAKAMVLIKQYQDDKRYYADEGRIQVDSVARDVFSQLIKVKQPDAAKTMLVYMDSSYYLQESRQQLAECYFTQANYAEAEEVLFNSADDAHSYSHSRYDKNNLMKKWVLSLLDDGKFNQANCWIDKYFPQFPDHVSERAYVEVVERCLAKNSLFRAKDIVEKHIKTPSTQLQLKRKLREAYLKKVASFIGDERMQVMYELHKKIQKYLLAPDQHRHEANLIVVELRSQLDKAFLAFYETHYGPKPDYLNIYFPVVKKVRSGKTVLDELQHYFKKFVKQPAFQQAHPFIFAFLHDIQPLYDAGYKWLAQLYRLANLQKHNEDLSSSPEVNGVKIDMSDYLPKVLDGVQLLMMKLFRPNIFPNSDKDEFVFSSFVPFHLPEPALASLSSTSSALLAHAGQPAPANPSLLLAAHT